MTDVLLVGKTTGQLYLFHNLAKANDKIHAHHDGFDLLCFYFSRFTADHYIFERIIFTSFYN